MAFKNCQRYIDLRSDFRNGYFGTNDPQYRKLTKLDRINSLAQDFDLSHRYLLEKGKFSQQDVNYAFALSGKETAGKLNFYGPQSDPIKRDNGDGSRVSRFRDTGNCPQCPQFGFGIIAIVKHNQAFLLLQT